MSGLRWPILRLRNVAHVVPIGDRVRRFTRIAYPKGATEQSAWHHDAYQHINWVDPPLSAIVSNTLTGSMPQIESNIRSNNALYRRLRDQADWVKTERLSPDASLGGSEAGRIEGELRRDHE